MLDIGTEVCAFDNGVLTTYTLPNTIINDDMQNRSYIVHTVSKSSFDITMHFGNPLAPRQSYYRNHDTNAELVREFNVLLNSRLWEKFKSVDIANIYELINGDILEFIYSGSASEARFKYHYFESDDGDVYDIKIMRDVISFMVSVTNITYRNS